MNDFLTVAATEAGRPYGLTAEQAIAHMLLGNRLHGDAGPGECGAVDPHDRDEAKWCRCVPGHTGDHNSYGPPPEYPPFDKPHPDAYLIAECFSDGESIGAWTSERPGITGPRDLEQGKGHLAQNPPVEVTDGFRYYWSTRRNRRSTDE